jgi:capsular exopolysaccharide synthesis family protein
VKNDMHLNGDASPAAATSSASDALLAPAASNFGSPLDLVKIVRRQFWLITACASVGVALAISYWMRAETWYESTAKILVNQGSQGLAVTSQNRTAKDEAVVDEDVLANHMEIIRSRSIIEAALKKNNLQNLPSITSRLDEGTDAVEYVTEHLDMKRGGEGSAKTARSLNIAFKHTDPADAQTVLQAILVEYESFLGDQLRHVMSKADTLIREAQSKIENDLKIAQEQYVKARKEAPVLFQGEGSSNASAERYRRLQEEMLEVQIKESSTRTRLDKVRQALATRASNNSIEEDVELLALIDSESLDRLTAFATLQGGAGTSAEFLSKQPERLQQATIENNSLLLLMTEELKKRADFGPQHPEVLKLQAQIELTKSFIEEKKSDLSLPFGAEQISPAKLLEIYVGFLQHDLATLDERKKELASLSAIAEEEAKALTEFEMNDKKLQGEIERKQQLFDGIVDQLRELDTASGLSGYIQELLESPRLGAPVWPDLKICGAGGLLLGMLAGIFLAVVNDRLDGRFRSAADVDQSINLRVLGRVGKLRRGRTPNVAAIVCDELTADGEVFRLIRTVMQGSVKTGRLRAISVTSPMSKDGKSSITANLAASFAQSGISTLLVDADLRRPTAHRIFGTKVSPGLADVLTGQAGAEEAIERTPFENLQLLTAGSSVERPTELLQSEIFDDFLAKMKDSFQLVLIDTGPILSVADSAVVAQKTDGMLMVVRPSNGTRDQAQDAVGRLRAVGANLLGCILNTYGSGKEFAVGGGYYGYYASEYKMTPRQREAATPINGNGNGKTNGKAGHIIRR